MATTKYRAAKFVVYLMIIIGLCALQNTPNLLMVAGIKPMLAYLNSKKCTNNKKGGFQRIQRCNRTVALQK